MTTTITKDDAKKMLENHNDGTIFTVVFRKKTDGSIRKMNCRKGVKKGVSSSLAYRPKDYDLVSVYDVKEAMFQKSCQIKKSAFRMISIDGLISMKINKVEYLVQ